MTRVVFLLLFLPILAFSQPVRDSTGMLIPKWTVWLDVINFQDNYPAILLAVERQFDKDFALQQEFGVVITPEAYNSENDFNQYLGFKGRTELLLYSNYYAKKKSRDFISIDVAYQYDQYVMDYRRDMGSFFQIESGKFTRALLGSHIRIGTQRYLSNERIIISGSFGLGRMFYTVKKPPGTEEFRNYGITRNSQLDPFSANLRLKIGFILGKLPK